jgi:uncharacterized protein involved in exopolysaccharide biosynthesis
MMHFAQARRSAVTIVADPARRRWAYAVLVLALAILCILPRPYVARAKMVPQDTNSIGLGSMMNAVGGQLQSFAALFGGAKQPIDLYLAIGRGSEVRDQVIVALKLAGPDAYGSQADAHVALERKVDIHSLTGGIVEVEVRTHDAVEAQALARAYVSAISDRIVVLGRDRIARKRQIVLQRFREASTKVASAEAALNGFRRRNNLAEPEAQLGSALALRTGLQAQLQAKLVELQTLQRFQGVENPQLQSVQSQVASLRSQIARTAEPRVGAAGPNVAGLSEVTNEYVNLYRDYRFAQALYEAYARASEELAIETLAGEIASQVQVIEAPRLDTDRKLNITAVALLLLVLLAALFTEIYAPATGINLRLRRPGNAGQ